MLNIMVPILRAELVVPIYGLYALTLSARIADVLGFREDAAEFRRKARRIRTAFSHFYVREDGTLKTNLMGVYVLALHFHLVPERKRQRAADELVRMIEANGNRLDTGFASVEYLLDTLCEIGREDIAYKVFFQEECPSWLYEVSQGATTIWEKWNAVTTRGEVQKVSFNHYAFGCVADWIYRHIVGLNVVRPGYRTFRVEPHPACGLRHVREEFESRYGTIIVEWHAEKVFSLSVTVPAGTEAEIVLPDGRKEHVGSGTWNFESE